jgi:thiol-disulfide isomerase/thioredoxin
MKKTIIFILIIAFFTNCKSNKTDSNVNDKVPESVINENLFINTSPVVLGGTIEDFMATEKNGKTIQLSHLYKKNKFLLLDFWSSRCIPCRKENPNLVNLYQQYHSKGFEIVSVSVDDDKQMWLNAIEQDKLSWIQICDLNSWSGAIPKQFNIIETPTCFLINQEGTVVDINLKGEALQSKLKREFN